MQRAGLVRKSTYNLVCTQGDENKAQCINALVDAGVKDYVVYEELCSQANFHTSGCIDTVRSTGMKRPDYKAMCGEASLEKTQCFMAVANVGFPAPSVATYTSICGHANIYKAKCVEFLGLIGIKGEGHHRSICVNTTPDKLSCLSTVHGLRFKYPQSYNRLCKRCTSE